MGKVLKNLQEIFEGTDSVLNNDRASSLRHFLRNPSELRVKLYVKFLV
jgi:hypothetical protein